MTVPGLAIFYGGMVRKKNILSTMYYSFASAVVVGALWVLGLYSLAFGSDVGGIIGNLEKFLFSGVNKDSLTGTIPETVFSAYQLMFAVITVALISGALVERLRFSAWLVFITLWSFLVYAPLAHWVWGRRLAFQARRSSRLSRRGNARLRGRSRGAYIFRHLGSRGRLIYR